jgi:hypothetical protein
MTGIGWFWRLYINVLNFDTRLLQNAIKRPDRGAMLGFILRTPSETSRRTSREDHADLGA